MFKHTRCHIKVISTTGNCLAGVCSHGNYNVYKHILIVFLLTRKELDFILFQSNWVGWPNTGRCQKVLCWFAKQRLAFYLDVFLAYLPTLSLFIYIYIYIHIQTRFPKKLGHCTNCEEKQNAMMWKFQISIFYSEYSIDDISMFKLRKCIILRGK